MLLSLPRVGVKPLRVILNRIASYGKQQEASLRDSSFWGDSSECRFASAAEVGFVQKIKVVFMRQRGLNNSDVLHKAYLDGL